MQAFFTISIKLLTVIYGCCKKNLTKYDVYAILITVTITNIETDKEEWR